MLYTSRALLGMSPAGGACQLQIKVSPNRTKNSSRGVIYCPDLKDTSDDDIVDGLAEYGVTAVRRIHTKRGGATSAHNLILTRVPALFNFFLNLYME